MERVQKIISNAGFCSRRKAEDLIDKGLVKVNGKIITLGDKASNKDEIIIQGKPLRYQRKEYLLMHKPSGYITTRDDSFGRKTVMDLLRKSQKDSGIYPVGRLDKTTTGAIIFTNDGDFANKILHPSYEVKKTYIATLDKNFHHKEQLERGIFIEDKKVKPRVRDIEPKVVEVVIHEGMNHIVKKLFEALNYKVVKLSRIKIGVVKLDIQPGKTRKLHKSEIKYFQELSRKPRTNT